MADYYGKVRTNYFALKDVDKFNEIIKNIVSEDEFMVEQNKEGKYSFACYSIIDYRVSGSEESDDEEYDMNEFFDKMKECIADDDAMIFTEIGSEKLRYFVAYSAIVTSKEVRYVNLENLAIECAEEMLGVETFKTQTTY